LTDSQSDGVLPTRDQTNQTDRLSIFMVALLNRAEHYIFMLWFVLSSSSSFSSPNISRRRFDVCHTSTHGVALVQI